MIDPYEPSWHGLDPSDPDLVDDPFGAIRTLRETAPVHRTPLGYWRLSRYRDCERLLRELPAGVRHRDGRLPLARPGDEDLGFGSFMLQLDPPDHTRLRKLVSKAFTPRAVARFRTRAQEVVDDCLAKALPSGEMDVVADLALPVPATLISEMMGVPVEDRDRFTAWTGAATYQLAGPLATEGQARRAREAILSLAGYFHQLIADRRAAPAEDLISDLIRVEEDGDQLEAGELLVQCIGLLIAGYETTIGLIANGVRNLIRHPDQCARLRSEPELIASAVEECLRFEGPVGATIRVVREDVELGGVRIPADSSVIALLWGANRDPERFADPERFDIGRTDNGHLGFGGGAHLCLGIHLARLEAQLAIGGLVARTDDLELVEPTVSWGRSLFRVPERLPVRLRARASS